MKVIPVSKTSSSSISGPNDRVVAIWLLVICAMVFAMVVLGGFTRLTESGLSMTDWRPVTGWLPPLSDAQWMTHFDGYRLSPEYNKVNAGMTLAEFKGIFWLEYLHRLWGRLIGVAFALPFVVFLYKRWIAPRMLGRLALLFALGGLQGGIGWWMVKSGLIDQPDVSQYRLAVHLLTAFLIYALGLWFALDLLRPSVAEETPVKLRRLASLVLGMVFVTAFSGALVAGLNAGLVYNTFPLMMGDVFPPEGFGLSPWYLNFFEDIPTVQFDHRVLAISTFCMIFIIWVMAQGVSETQARRSTVLLGAAVLQVSLGIATLMMSVPVLLGAMHQAGAVLLLTAAIWYRHGMKRNH